MKIHHEKFQNLKMINCSKCNGDMPELRKINFGYDFCITCSDKYGLIGKKRAITIQKGEGDHTWNETIIMSEKEFLEYEQQEERHLKLIGKNKSNKAEIISLESDDSISKKSVKFNED